MSVSQGLFRSPATILKPSSIALVGASERGKWQSQMYGHFRQFGYAGKVYLVNPRQKEVYGQPCYPSLRDLPEKVDHAMVLVPAVGVPDVIKDAEAAGVTTATIYSAAVGDGDDPESRKRGAWLKQFLSTSKLRISGPNCMGSFSYREHVFAYPNTELCRVPAGSVGCAFQSGGTLQFYMRTGSDRGLRFSYGVTTGNEADLDLADFMNFLIDDPETRQIVLFIEGIRRPDAFMAAAGRALEVGKPVLAIKTGATAKSRAAAQSHTGAIGGDYAAYLAMCDRYGICNFRSLDDLVEGALAFQGGRLPRGPRVGFVTTSGGTVDLLYDYAESDGVVIPDYTADTAKALQPYMQESIPVKNPLDLGIPSTMQNAADVCEIVSKDPNVDMVAWAAMLPNKKGAWDGVEALTTMLARTDKPVIGFGRMYYQTSADMVEAQESAGFPFLQGLQPTVRAMNALWHHAERRGRKVGPPPSAKPSALTPATLEAELARAGITLPKSKLAATSAEAAAAAEAIGFPVVLKIQSPDILHKTEAGGVALDLRSGKDVQAAAEALLASARAAKPDARIDGFLVQEMVSGIEAIVGALNDPLYGPLLLVGAGGILVELAKDSSLRLLPVSAAEVSTMVEGLKLNKLLAGYRGRAAADRAALEKTALALAQFYLDHREKIAEIEINPLMVRPNGTDLGSTRDRQANSSKSATADLSGAVAVDVRVVWRDR